MTVAELSEVLGIPIDKVGRRAWHLRRLGYDVPSRISRRSRPAQRKPRRESQAPSPAEVAELVRLFHERRS